jgi:23S rRNA (uridine2552-2'-O)-methyltransferase
MVSLQNVIFIEGDIALRTTQARVIATLKKHKRTKADVIISDIAPKLSGNRTIDNARALELWMHALQFATLALKPGGAMIIKVFQGDACQYFLAKVDSTFEFWKLYRPEATRMRSAEIYMIAKGFKP